MAAQSFSPDGCGEEILEDLLQTHGAMVYRLAIAMVHAPADAEDIFQEVFLRYIRKRPAFATAEHGKAWFIQVTVNCAKSFLTSPWRKRIQMEPSPEPLICFTKEEEGELYAALLELPPKYRAPLHLYYYEGYSTEEISRMLHIKPSTVRMQLSRGRAQLKEKLKGGWENENPLPNDI